MDPDLLPYERSPPGIETHIGNQVAFPGDTQDECITSWLTGTTDQAACACALTIAAAGGPAGAGCADDAGAE
jgi:hypothetical protein